jgi:hypothetical protein
MTANTWNGTKASQPLLYGDTEAVAASGMPLPSLRVLKAAGAIQSQKIPKENGGFKRMWREEDVLIASIGTAMSEHFAWNIRIVAEAMAKTQPGTWSALTTSIAGIITTDTSALIRKDILDWHLDLIDRKFLFLRVPREFTAILPDAAWGQTDLILGWATSKDTFQLLPWQLSNAPGRNNLEKILGNEKIPILAQYYKLAMATHANALSTASINISMQVRATWRRLHGLDARFLQEIMSQKGASHDPAPRHHSSNRKDSD